MVNSVRLSLSGGGASSGGTLDISLLATDRIELSKLRGNMISAHAVDASGYAFDGATINVKIRYDHARAAAQGLTEAELRMFAFDGARASDVTASVDTVNKLITSDPLSSLATIVVGTDVGSKEGAMVFVR